MNTYELQVDKEKAFNYLISKGYKLKLWVTDLTNCPKEIAPFVETKKINLFTLTDPKGREVIDQIVCEYGAVPSDFETRLRRLVRYK